MKPVSKGDLGFYASREVKVLHIHENGTLDLESTDQDHTFYPNTDPVKVEFGGGEADGEAEAVRADGGDEGPTSPAPATEEATASAESALD
jgi:hypothetical protein